MFESIWVQLITAQVAVAEQPRDVLAIMLEAGGVVKGVIILLVILSVVCWYIIGYKAWYLRRARVESVRFLEIFWQSKQLDAIFASSENYPRSPIAQVYRTGYKELIKVKSVDEEGATMRMQLGGIENVERALRRAMTSEATQLERLLPFLATTGSNAVFIGLFGTVWGIMVAFVNIHAAGAAGLDVVAGPIAESLIVTAVGLVTAIPAGVAFNWFLSQIKVLNSEMDNFSNDFLNIVKRHFFK